MNDPTATLLNEIAGLKKTTRYLRERNRKLVASRDYWKREAVELKRARRRGQLYLSTPSPDLSPTERAEASGVG